ncbi:MAG: hypothetical protein J6B91_06775 [Prevotella sp.]|nr:hypothetical protein [Prevotella sp.]
MKRLITKIFPIAVLMMMPCISASGTDKVDADRILFELLSDSHVVENWHEPLAINDRSLRKTAEDGLFLVEGKAFQVNSLRSDFYVVKEKSGWKPVEDKRYPMETAVNLLLNRIENNKHGLMITHHQYGGKNPRVMLQMQVLYDLLARNMKIYCSVTSINASEMQAVLVFHNEKRNFIHMLRVTIPTDKLFKSDSMLTADMYTNIPQDNIKSIFKDKK